MTSKPALETNSSVELRPMTDDDWPAVRSFLAAEWAPDHPLLDRELFRWQFRGFGPDAGLGSTPLAWVDGRLAGMRGVIPSHYQVPRFDGSYRLVSGCATSMWIVGRAYRGRGLGYRLWRETHDRFGVRVALGANESTAVPFFRRAGYRRMDALHHWFYPLDEVGFCALAFGDWDGCGLDRRAGALTAGPAAPWLPPPDALGKAWQRSVGSVGLFGLYRSSEFWGWRYQSHPTFDYLFFGDLESDGLVVARVDYVDTAETPGTLQVLRLIELIPARSATWEGEVDPAFDVLVHRVLRWARDSGCVAADYRCSSQRLASALRRQGFFFRLSERPDRAGRGFAGLLRPLRRSPKPINAHWSVDHEDRDRELVDDDVYLVKSDNDMDRPNDPVLAGDRRDVAYSGIGSGGCS